jgi:hypothetical protein
MMLPSKKGALDFPNEKLIATYLLLPLITFARDKCLPNQRGSGWLTCWAFALSKAHLVWEEEGCHFGKRALRGRNILVWRQYQVFC